MFYRRMVVADPRLRQRLDKIAERGREARRRGEPSTIPSHYFGRERDAWEGGWLAEDYDQTRKE